MTRDLSLFRTAECSLAISRPAAGRLLVVLSGRDRGQLGAEPFAALERELESGQPLELFIDLEDAVGASLDVSGSWALWLRRNRARLARVSMLTGSYFVQLSAQAVKRFSELGEKAHLYSDRSAFESALRRPLAS